MKSIPTIIVAILLFTSCSKKAVETPQPERLSGQWTGVYYYILWYDAKGSLVSKDKVIWRQTYTFSADGTGTLLLYSTSTQKFNYTKTGNALTLKYLGVNVTYDYTLIPSDPDHLVWQSGTNGVDSQGNIRRDEYHFNKL